MTAEIINGSKIAESIKARIKEEISKLESKPGLAMIVIGDNPESKIYVNMKEKACKEVGINSKNYFLPENTSEEEVKNLILKLNNDKEIHGILLQLPLPENLNTNKIIECISPEKDVDGLTKIGFGKLIFGNEELAPCTPKGIIKLLESYNINLEGKDCVIINHSNVIGKPLAIMLLNRNATVSVCHIHTKNIIEHTKKADILISGAGKPNLIIKEMIKEGCIVIDAGISKINGKIQGDVDFESVKHTVSYITPVPGGVGPMTIAMLLENTLNAYKIS